MSEPSAGPIADESVDVAATLAEFASVLRAGGILLLSVMARETRNVGTVTFEDGWQFPFPREESLQT